MITFNRFRLRVDGHISQKYSHGIHNNMWKTTGIVVVAGNIVAPARPDMTSEQIKEHFARAEQYMNGR